MSRVTELENEIKELENKRTELIKKLEVEKQKQDIDYPFNYTENCYLLSNNGVIVEDWWSSSGNDRNSYRQGNFFKTKEEAERERDRRDLLTRFRQFRDKRNGDWKPDFKDGWEDKYSIIFNYKSRELEIANSGYNDNFRPFGYFQSREDCERAIEIFGDEIKRLFVEEE